jgi:pimeloyl-ACP methyl ester carboxylesterase
MTARPRTEKPALRRRERSTRPRTTRRLPLHFLHANGFPSSSYRAMFAALEPGFVIDSIEMLGHDPAYPVTDGWPHLVAQLVDKLAARRSPPVIGVGHSLGAYVTFMAATLRPELFRAVIMIDAPIIYGWKGTAFGMIKRLGLADRVTPAGATRDRRAEWPSRAEARAHLGSRGVFRSFDPRCLDDYVRHGTRRARIGVRLAYAPAIEYEIYRTTPHDLEAYLPRFAVPGGMLLGRDSDVVRRVGLAASKRRFVLRWVPGGHLFPFEHPEVAAAAITDLAHELTSVAPSGSAATR